jgi:alpha-tubulin suppressor-like RCC1 family protein
VVAVGSNGYGQCDVSSWYSVEYIACAGNTSYGVRTDGTVLAAGDNAYGQCNVATDVFTNIKRVACSGEFVIGLKRDGTIVMTGNTAKVTEALSWKDIKDISVLGNTVVALKDDGTVLACGDIDPTAVADWSNVKTIAAGYCYAVAITADGETLSTTTLPELLKDSLRIECGMGHILALKSDGTVVAIGGNTYGECDVTAWCDIMIN